MHNFRIELNEVIQKSLESIFGKVTVIKEECDSKSENVICTEFIYRTEHINTDREFFQVTIKMTSEQVQDGSTYFYTSLRFEKNKW